jgi:hypothetical protein
MKRGTEEGKRTSMTPRNIRTSTINLQPTPLPQIPRRINPIPSSPLRLINACHSQRYHIHHQHNPNSNPKRPEETTHIPSQQQHTSPHPHSSPHSLPLPHSHSRRAQVEQYVTVLLHASSRPSTDPMVDLALELGGGRGRVGGEWGEGGKKAGAVGWCALETRRGWCGNIASGTLTRDFNYHCFTLWRLHQLPPLLKPRQV